MLAKNWNKMAFNNQEWEAGIARRRQYYAVMREFAECPLPQTIRLYAPVRELVMMRTFNITQATHYPLYQGDTAKLLSPHITYSKSYGTSIEQCLITSHDSKNVWFHIINSGEYKYDVSDEPQTMSMHQFTGKPMRGKETYRYVNGWAFKGRPMLKPEWTVSELLVEACVHNKELATEIGRNATFYPRYVSVRILSKMLDDGSLGGEFCGDPAELLLNITLSGLKSKFLSLLKPEVVRKMVWDSTEVPDVPTYNSSYYLEKNQLDIIEQILHELFQRGQKGVVNFLGTHWAVPKFTKIIELMIDYGYTFTSDQIVRNSIYFTTKFILGNVPKDTRFQTLDCELLRQHRDWQITAESLGMAGITKFAELHEIHMSRLARIAKVRVTTAQPLFSCGEMLKFAGLCNNREGRRVTKIIKLIVSGGHVDKYFSIESVKEYNYRDFDSEHAKIIDNALPGFLKALFEKITSLNSAGMERFPNFVSQNINLITSEIIEEWYSQRNYQWLWLVRHRINITPVGDSYKALHDIPFPLSEYLRNKKEFELTQDQANYLARFYNAYCGLKIRPDSGAWTLLFDEYTEFASKNDGKDGWGEWRTYEVLRKLDCISDNWSIKHDQKFDIWIPFLKKHQSYGTCGVIYKRYSKYHETNSGHPKIWMFGR